MSDKEEQMNPAAETLRKVAAKHEQDAADSFERSDTDGALSQWASQMSAQKARLMADIEQAGGVATFGRYHLETLSGERCRARLIRGRFGMCWAFTDGSGDLTGTFIGAHPARESTLSRKGYREVEEEFVAPAVADLAGNGGTGLSGATSVRAIVRPRDMTVRYDRVICLGQEDDEC